MLFSVRRHNPLWLLNVVNYKSFLLLTHNLMMRKLDKYLYYWRILKLALGEGLPLLEKYCFSYATAS
jgi:hypothetical protein